MRFFSRSLFQGALSLEPFNAFRALLSQGCLACAKSLSPFSVRFSAEAFSHNLFAWAHSQWHFPCLSCCGFIRALSLTGFFTAVFRRDHFCPFFCVRLFLGAFSCALFQRLLPCAFFKTFLRAQFRWPLSSAKIFWGDSRALFARSFCRVFSQAFFRKLIVYAYFW